MPYRSAKQRAFMHAKHPGIAARWDKETGGKIVPSKKKSTKKTSGKPLPAKVAKPVVGKTAKRRSK